MINNRRHEVLARITSRCDEVHTGFMKDGVPSACHLWQGSTSGEGRGGGYGRISLNGHTVATHLVVFTHYYGYIPGNKQIDHLCNQRKCCNPHHLELVSHIVNQRRKFTRKLLHIN